MLSLRSFTRAVPRSFSSVSAQCSRRSFTTVRQPSLLQQSWMFASRPRLAAFSTSRSVWAQEGQVDQELAAKLQSELDLEKDMRDSEKLPANLQDYLDRSSFVVKDATGKEEVVLVRKFGDESIRVSFSIADLNNLDQDPDDYAEDKAQYDEDESDLTDTQSGGAQSKGTINQGRTEDGNFNVASEGRVAPADRPEQEDDESPNDDQGQPGFPARVNVMIEKRGKGVMQIDTTIQDGEVMIEDIGYYSRPELVDAQTAELNWSKRNLYTGPPFGNLDSDLQLLMERYLDERGINTELALWIPEYIDFKEQREYLNWLSNMKSFVEA